MARVFAISCVCIFALAAAPANAHRMGRVVDVVGDADIVSLNTGKKLVPGVGTVIMRDHRIRTGTRSLMEIQLDDGAKLIMRETSVLTVLAIKPREKDPPARIRLFSGTVRVITAPRFRTRTLVLRTPTAIVGAQGADFGVIASGTDARIVSFKGTIDVASSAERIIKSYAVGSGEEARVQRDTPPDMPHRVPATLFAAWFDVYVIDENDSIRRVEPDRDRGLIDTLLRKKRH